MCKQKGRKLEKGSGVYIYVPLIGMPSFHQESCAGGFDELESHINVASVSGFSSSGSSRIFTVSGATANNITLVSDIHPVIRNYLQCTLRTVDSKRGISVALLCASHR